MSDNTNAPRPENHGGWNGMRWDKGAPAAGGQRLEGSGAPVQPGNGLVRFLGGSPGAVLVRLLLMSLVVGALLVWLDIRPYEVFRAFERFFQRIWLMGFDAVRELATYIVAGALIVVPVWVVLRLMNMQRG